MQPQNSNANWIVYGVIGALFLCNLALCWFWGVRQLSLVSVLFIGGSGGILIGQLNLLAVWSAFSKGALVTRIPACILIVVMMWSSVCIGDHLSGLFSESRNWQTSASSTLLLLSLMGGSLVTQLPLWVASRVSGWRLVSGTYHERSRSYGVKDLLAAMMLLAFAIVLFQGTQTLCGFVISGETITADNDWVILGLFAAASLVNLVLVSPCFWFAFRWDFSLMLMLGLIAGVVILSILELSTILVLAPAPMGRQDMIEWLQIYGLFVFANLFQVIVVLGVLRILRNQAGFRLLSRSEVAEEIRQSNASATDVSENVASNEARPGDILGSPGDEPIASIPDDEFFG